MIYSKILGKNYSVGIIYFPDYKNRDSLKNILNELREFFWPGLLLGNSEIQLRLEAWGVGRRAWGVGVRLSG